MFQEDVKGLRKVWILGDNFVAETYRRYFRKSDASFFLKMHFNVLPFCSSKYSDRNSNMISRIINCLITAINNKVYLPHYVLVAIDDDLVSYQKYKGFGVAALYGNWLEYLQNTINTVLKERRESLPINTVNPDQTQVYWVEPANHAAFSKKEREIREKFLVCLDASTKVCDNVRILKIREPWDRLDPNLVQNDGFTKNGLALYWKAIDASFAFNVKKRDEILIRSRFRNLKQKTDKPADTRSRISTSSRVIKQDQLKTTDHEDQPDDTQEDDDILRFFQRHRTFQDRYHWKAPSTSPRFILPKIRKTASTRNVVL